MCDVRFTIWEFSDRGKRIRKCVCYLRITIYELRFIDNVRLVPSGAYVRGTIFDVRLRSSHALRENLVNERAETLGSAYVRG